MPPHKIYCEVFDGGASVLFQKPKGKGEYAEIYNDIDNDLVNFFRVVQKRPWDLIGRIFFTPTNSKKPGVENRKKVRTQRKVIYWNYELGEKFIDSLKIDTSVQKSLLY